MPTTHPERKSRRIKLPPHMAADVETAENRLLLSSLKFVLKNYKDSKLHDVDHPLIEQSIEELRLERMMRLKMIRGVGNPRKKYE